MKGQGVQDHPKIQDYGYIADCHSAALVSVSGSIDWCCMPQIDSDSCFCRILDWDKGGYCRICPSGPYESSRRYQGNTLILETTFQTATGRFRLLDAFTMHTGGEHDPYQQILRIAEGLAGIVDMTVELLPRFGYGSIRPWIRRAGPGHHIAIGGSDGLYIHGNFPLEMLDRHGLACSCSIGKGQRRRLSIIWRKPEDLDEGRIEVPDDQEMDRRMQGTVGWWESWSSQCSVTGPFETSIRRSAIVLKGLSNAPTGAIAAAPTTSLPEAPGGCRNWDYRYSWIRDSCFTVRSLGRVGYHREADGFRRFIERSAAGTADDLQVLYGVSGGRSIYEHTLDHLSGFRGAQPVRVGNEAKYQLQLDVFGEMLDLSWEWHSRGFSPDNDYCEFLVELVNKAARTWKEPDQGIWEIRGAARHFVHSKVMCWSALDRGIRLAEDLELDAPLEDWKQARDEVCRAVEERGYDPERGIFIQAFDYPVMDAALLLLPMFGYLDYRDPRMVRTVDAVKDELEEGGLIRRYPTGDDGLEGREGVFVACTFWLAECLVRQGRRKEAEEALTRAMATANELGLFPEEYDPATGDMLGNFPQGLSHLSLINAAYALENRD